MNFGPDLESDAIEHDTIVCNEQNFLYVWKKYCKIFLTRPDIKSLNNLILAWLKKNSPAVRRAGCSQTVPSRTESEALCTSGFLFPTSGKK